MSQADETYLTERDEIQKQYRTTTAKAKLERDQQLKTAWKKYQQNKQQEHTQ